MPELKRRTLEGVGRVYLNEETDTVAPSVSTVLSAMETPEALSNWKQRNDGKDGNPYWRIILAYKSARGTLIHYELLNQYSAVDIGGRNEEKAEETLEFTGWVDEYEEDLAFAEEAWEEISEMRGITQESVLNVECFVENTDVGYAGQFDLLYIDKNGDVCLSDIKTSTAVYDKHQLQASAYCESVPVDVDTTEIIRIHPDSETWEVVHDTEWTDNNYQPITREDRFEEFVELREKLEIDKERIKEEGVDDG